MFFFLLVFLDTRPHFTEKNDRFAPDFTRCWQTGGPWSIYHFNWTLNTFYAHLMVHITVYSWGFTCQQTHRLLGRAPRVLLLFTPRCHVRTSKQRTCWEANLLTCSRREGSSGRCEFLALLVELFYVPSCACACLGVVERVPCQEGRVVNKWLPARGHGGQGPLLGSGPTINLKINMTGPGVISINDSKPE